MKAVWRIHMWKNTIQADVFMLVITHREKGVEAVTPKDVALMCLLFWAKDSGEAVGFSAFHPHAWRWIF